MDAASRDRLAADGLLLDVLDEADTTDFASWLRAEFRGFHDSRPSVETIAVLVRELAYRRTTGVWERDEEDAGDGRPSREPVATVSSWPTALTVPGARSVTAWAISAVTVSPTHRRRGIARALLEAELRTAVAVGAPVAILTVSEATIYSRYGFAPAVMTVDLAIDTRRARWLGPRETRTGGAGSGAGDSGAGDSGAGDPGVADPGVAEYGVDRPTGRITFVESDAANEIAELVDERARLHSPGEIERWPLLRSRILGRGPDDTEKAKKLRFVSYTASAGQAEGYAVFSIVENEADFSASTLRLDYLASATDAAYAALWRFILEMDLVATVTAPMRSVDEPLAWMVDDARAVRVTARQDHLWTRILDVPGALEAREYSVDGRVVLEVADPFGWAAGRYLLAVDSGRASVERLADEPGDDGSAASGVDTAAEVVLDVAALSAIYLGGVSAVTLARAARLGERRPGSAALVDAMFASRSTPWLSVWF